MFFIEKVNSMKGQTKKFEQFRAKITKNLIRNKLRKLLNHQFSGQSSENFEADILLTNFKSFLNEPKRTE